MPTALSSDGRLRQSPGSRPNERQLQHGLWRFARVGRDHQSCRAGDLAPGDRSYTNGGRTKRVDRLMSWRSQACAESNVADFARLLSRAVVVLMLTATAACSEAGDNSPPQSNRSSTTEGPAAGDSGHLADEAEASVREYVQALGEQRYDAAFRLLCKAARGADDAATLRAFELSASGLADELGGFSIDVARAVRVEAREAIVVVKLAESASGSLVVLARENGRFAPCQQVVEGSDTVISAMPEAAADVPTSVTLEDFASLQQPTGFEALPVPEVGDGFLTTDPASRGARAQLWRHQASGVTVRVTALDYSSSAAAKRIGRQIESSFGQVVVAGIRGPGPATRGFRLLGSRGVLVQPVGAGPVTDFLALRYGPRLYTIYATAVPPPQADYTIVLAVAEVVAAQAARREQAPANA